jgi:hypothetical protein
MKKGALYTAGSIVILFICLIAFVLPASLGRGGNQKPLEFGKYNGRKIAYESGSDFANFVSYYAEMFRNQGMQIDSSNQYYVFNYAFNSTVMKYAYEDAVKESGFKVPKEAVNRQLRRYFYDENGKFSKKLYNQADPARVEEMRASIQDNLYTGRFQNDNFGSETEIFGTTALFGLKEADAELDFIKNYESEKRGFNLATFKKSNYPEEEKLAFANKNTAKFIKYDISIITVEEEAQAKKIAKDLEKGNITFEDAISEYSQKSYSDTEGKLTNTYQYQLENILNDKADLDKIVSLPKDSVSPVIQTLLGYSIFRTDGDAVQPDFTSDDMKSRVTSYINSYESTMVEDYYIAQANLFATEAKAKGFDAACESLGIEKKEIAPFPLNYGNASVCAKLDTSIEGLGGAATNENFLKAAFSLNLNDYSEPLVINDYVVVVQYTNTETADSEAETSTSFISDIQNYDNAAAQDAIMDGKKLENNFMTTYYSNLM